MKIIRINDSSEFDSTVSQAVLDNPTSHVFVLLFGTEEPQTGESWCPDCVIADPVVRRHISKIPDSILIEVPVGPRLEFRKPDNFYRNHKSLNLTAIPTLYLWKQSGPAKSLVEVECADESKWAEFVKEL
ncbi:uncharacterized protein BJ171DRAFT_236136 [Polychytrium aggregatum]|uniref:uncharacterized protein n=1 Tax=Polychytrium aggregatum TaxID=110093 RepID=UPI0022FDD6F6|nr:uncharacterized protein BJ171DRAFT_236136 [Polychytrium aggregatum]KAI9208194.1 hypothetical protein BJ171DRAFT_236136 [Polychytrium aggregatum]